MAPASVVWEQLRLWLSPAVAIDNLHVTFSVDRCLMLLPFREKFSIQDENLAKPLELNDGALTWVSFVVGLLQGFAIGVQQIIRR
ncbi:hypothetical protein AV530_016874 [Patagioenas fasciata monilis]|uniref:Uncharacterized protein n=1 Tax=Patagioenas fasciata monilis TaxID=372326 RepID=A0A1V4J425_PATFA|nr:hypothetical protein AV530_016874 [Patagioenas fasciata monilis]